MVFAAASWSGLTSAGENALRIALRMDCIEWKTWEGVERARERLLTVRSRPSSHSPTRSSHSATMAAVPRILMLPGYTQNAAIFASKLGAVRKGLVGSCELVFVDPVSPLFPPPLPKLMERDSRT